MAGGKRHCNACMEAAASPPVERGPADDARAGHRWGRCAGRTGKGRMGAYMTCRW